MLCGLALVLRWKLWLLELSAVRRETHRSRLLLLGVSLLHSLVEIAAEEGFRCEQSAVDRMRITQVH